MQVQIAKWPIPYLKCIDEPPVIGHGHGTATEKVRPSTFFGGEPGLPGVSALAWPSLASSSRANGATARAAARGSQAGVLLRAQPRAASWMAAARICSTRVTPEQAEGQREANRSGRRAGAWSTLDSRLGRQ